MKTNITSVANQRDLIKRKKKLKKEIKLIILKSFIRNRNLTPSIRAVFFFKFNSFWKKGTSESNQQNICIKSGKKKTTFQISNMSRQLTKRFIEHGLIQGVKIR